MAISLTNFKIEQVDGGLALLPNQPLLQGCQVSSAQSTALNAGDIVTIDGTNAKQGIITVKKAAVTDTPLGIVLTDPIKQVLQHWIEFQLFLLTAIATKQRMQI